MTVKTALAQGAKLLDEGGLDAPRLNAEVLLAHALQRDRVWLFSHSEDELSQNGWLHYGRYLHQRLGGKPTQYITKRQEFYGREFFVSPFVLIPRPETEQVVEVALSRARRGAAIIDVGCGSGAIAVTLSLELRSNIFACDVSAEALEVTRKNASLLGARVTCCRTDLLSAYRAGAFDMVVSNPPYIGLREGATLQREVRDFEPALALFAGPIGTEVYKRLIAEAELILRPAGTLVLELGHDSLQPVSNMLGSGWSVSDPAQDLQGIPRVLAAVSPS